MALTAARYLNLYGFTCVFRSSVIVNLKAQTFKIYCKKTQVISFRQVLLTALILKALFAAQQLSLPQLKFRPEKILQNSSSFHTCGYRLDFACMVVDTNRAGPKFYHR